MDEMKQSYEERCETERQQQEWAEKQKQALEVWKESGGTGSFCSDALSVNLVFDKIELSYSEETGLKLVVKDGEREIDITDSFRIERLTFQAGNFPVIAGRFMPSSKLQKLTTAQVEMADATGINERIRKHHESLRPKRPCIG